MPNRGFTLIELLVTLLVAAILLTVGVPAMRTLIQDNRLTAQVNDLVAALQLMRTEAVRRGTAVSMCAPGSGGACAAVAAATGWTVFVDSGTTAGTVDAGDSVIRRFGPLGGGNTVTVLGFGGASRIEATARGTVPQGSGSFVLCDDRGAERARVVVVSGAGMIRLGVDGDGNGVREDHNGNNVTCP